MASETKRSRTLACTALTLLALGACDNPESRTPLPDWSDGYAQDIVSDGGGTGAPSVQFGTYADMVDGSFALVVPRSVDYPVRLRELGTAEGPCGVAPAEVGGGPPHREMACILEMDELDLYVQGLSFDIVVPEGGCEYVKYHLGMYKNYEVGDSPTEVAWTDNGDSTFSDAVNAVNGKPFCEYDYTPVGGPNCCFGAYDKTVRYPTGTTTTTTEFWGGEPGNCYDGAAYLDKDAVLAADGFAVGKYVFNEDRIGGAFVEHIETYGLSEHYFTTVPLASFFDPADHNGTMPAAYDDPLAVPVADFYCLDNAEEVRARLTLVIREWNQEVEFDRDGDPDTQGVEVSWPENPINDFPDFADLTPGNEDLPQQLPRRFQQ